MSDNKTPDDPAPENVEGDGDTDNEIIIPPAYVPVLHTSGMLLVPAATGDIAKSFHTIPTQ